MRQDQAQNQQWVKDQDGRIGLLLRNMNGWDVAYGTETKQSVDLANYELCDAQYDRPPVVDKRAGDGISINPKEKRK